MVRVPTERPGPTTPAEVTLATMVPSPVIHMNTGIDTTIAMIGISMFRGLSETPSAGGGAI